MYSGGHSCCLANCSSVFFGKKQIETRFRRFPKDQAKCAVWIEKCKPINLPTIDPDILNRNHRLCSLHFENEMYVNVEKTRLLKTAIPTLFKNDCVVTEETSDHVDVPSESLDDIIQTENVIIDKPPRCSTPVSSSLNTTSVSSCTSVETCSISIQTPNSLTAKTPRKRVLQERLSNALCSIKKLEQQLEQTTTVEHCMKMCEQYLSPSVLRRAAPTCVTCGLRQRLARGAVDGKGRTDNLLPRTSLID
eukprot:XP_008180534.1 PREDICTED: uncharacterized protein LOC103308622 [Acyrthosiphon pisum]